MPLGTSPGRPLLLRHCWHFKGGWSPDAKGAPTFDGVENALELRGLSKRYDDGTLALDDLDLEVPAGSFFGLLGPNGAGKTTLISAVCNLLRLTAGEICGLRPPRRLASRRAG